MSTTIFKGVILQSLIIGAKLGDAIEVGLPNTLS
jgi:hypothetical protein